MVIDRSRKIPLYYQIEQLILDKIRSGEYKPGDKIPTEAELQRIFGVSRITVRQAISRLVNAGWLRTEQGRGTFVTVPKISEEGSRFLGLSEELEQKGCKLENKIVRFKRLVPPQYVAEELGLEGKKKVYYFVRVRYVDGEPLVLNKIYLNPELVPNFSPDKMLKGSLIRTLEGLYGIKIGRSRITFEAVPAQSKEADYLWVKTGSPLLKMKRVMYTEDGKPLEYSHNFFRGDRYSYTVVLER